MLSVVGEILRKQGFALDWMLSGSRIDSMLRNFSFYIEGETKAAEPKPWLVKGQLSFVLPGAG